MKDHSVSHVAKKTTLLAARDRFDEIVKFLNHVGESRALHPHEYVLMGRSIQLGDGEGPCLEDAEKAFKMALAIDELYVSALLELGWFSYAVEDNAQKALPFFEKAREISKIAAEEAQQGCDECIQELQERAAESEETK